MIVELYFHPKMQRSGSYGSSEETGGTTMKYTSDSNIQLRVRFEIMSHGTVLYY